VYALAAADRSGLRYTWVALARQAARGAASQAQDTQRRYVIAPLV
jgi:hypothetical protein